LRKRREREIWVVVRDKTWGRRRNYITGFEGSQAVPACPSGISNAYNQNLFLYDVGRAAL
jgi:hypothetical protein